jgi:MYXO-CTERM domain-containing protein
MQSRITGRTRLLSAALCVCAILVASSASADQLVALSRGERAIYLIDTDDLGSPVKIGDISVGTDLDALALSPEGTLITTDRGSDLLITVSASDASLISQVTLSRDLPVRPRGFDFDPAGTLYGVFAGMDLCTIDRATGVCTTVVTLTGAAHVEALSFAPDGTLYATGSATGDATAEELYEVNLLSGALTLVGHTGLPDVDALTLGPSGMLFGTDSVAGISADLYGIDPNTGAGIVLGNTGVVEVNGLCAIPEPGTLTLLALGALTLLRRRRSAA